jgi:hypothetical protein
MNSKTYMKVIANEFGGLQKDNLLLKLKKLVTLAKNENNFIVVDGGKIEEKKIKVPDKINGNNYKECYMSYKSVLFDDKIDEIKSSRHNAYYKVMEILRLTNLYGGWHDIMIFDTVDLFNYFSIELEKLNSLIETRQLNGKQEFRIV